MLLLFGCSGSHIMPLCGIEPHLTIRPRNLLCQILTPFYFPTAKGQAVGNIKLYDAPVGVCQMHRYASAFFVDRYKPKMPVLFIFPQKHNATSVARKGARLTSAHLSFFTPSCYHKSNEGRFTNLLQF